MLVIQVFHFYGPNLCTLMWLPINLPAEANISVYTVYTRWQETLDFVNVGPKIIHLAK